MPFNFKNFPREKARFLNLACGAHYLKNDEWLNLDFQSRNKYVLGANLLKPLPLHTNSFDLVYCSHFIEHLVEMDASKLLNEIFRVLKPGGTLRLVTPDMENLATTYLLHLRTKNYLFADFVKTEIIDQFVRQEPGGAFSSWLKLAKDNRELADFIKIRTGISVTTKKTSETNEQNRNLSQESSLLNSTRIKMAITKLYCRILTRFFPEWFRRYHISLATPGERHFNLYDEYSLTDTLGKSGFCEIERVSHDRTNSGIPTITELDTLEDGSARGGQGSMFFEAKKPKIAF